MSCFRFAQNRISTWYILYHVRPQVEEKTYRVIVGLEVVGNLPSGVLVTAKAELEKRKEIKS